MLYSVKHTSENSMENDYNRLYRLNYGMLVRGKAIDSAYLLTPLYVIYTSQTLTVQLLAAFIVA